MSNRVEPQIPSITLDHDQVKTTRSNAHHSKGSIPASKTKNAELADKPSSSLSKLAFAILPYLVIAGTSGYFYQAHTAQNQLVAHSEQRIQQLENQLSATGEEMGESTIALKIKLESVSEKTELLLTEMDKLWSSAWRRNQKEIKELRSQQIKSKQQQTSNLSSTKKHTSSIAELNNKLTAVEFSIDATSERIVAANAIKDDITKLSAKINMLDNDIKTRDKQQMVTATSINEFDTIIQLLVERVDQLERKLQPTTTP